MDASSVPSSEGRARRPADDQPHDDPGREGIADTAGEHYSVSSTIALTPEP
jgi:hypothetical protein